MSLEILRLGNPVLRKIAQPLSLDELASERIQQLIDQMIGTMHEVHGAGLAAPQIGESIRLAIAQVAENPRYPSMPALPLRVWVNPKITVLAQQPRVAMYEGCLSIPGLRGRVVRPAAIRVDSLDRGGMPQVDVFDGPLAAVAQHECDHLDGQLFVDLAAPRSLTFLAEYEQFIPTEERVQLIT
jgi:peptide deformylase